MSKLKISTFGDPKNFWARVPIEVIHNLDIRDEVSLSKVSPDGRFCFLNMDEMKIRPPRHAGAKPEVVTDFDFFRDAADHQGLQYTLDHIEIGPDIDSELDRLQNVLVERRMAILGPEANQQQVRDEVSYALAQRFNKVEHAISQFPTMFATNEPVYLPDLEQKGIVIGVEPSLGGETLTIQLSDGNTVQRSPGDGCVRPEQERAGPRQDMDGPSLLM